ncbi:copper homeostasis protein CutC [Actinokineospora sp. NBRC 105648]|uniref:copper homeostasis protein CutC n=1 Tax=Actinokineospora sp. NBRC 105648 TaxID=3032206 RepID=UPI0024A220CD|nr:copper homeostasis protein CutC [Actinokineospora sp. NBRC 105648]GLZ39568.1 copper homeostasis protein CutC [Actinokineospora sp. NBRC 105648]
MGGVTAPSPPRGLLEIIALTVADAVAAQAGGADRIEVVAHMDRDGLTPAPALIAEMQAAVDIPLRVMVRGTDGFTADAEELTRLLATVAELRGAGAQEFVLGFLTADGHIDLAATGAVVAALDGCPWTFHRAVDHATDTERAWSDLRGLPGLDTVLTAGSARGLEDGLPRLAARDDWKDAGVRLLAGGGLKHVHVAGLRSIGVNAIHAGGLVRDDWDSPVCAERVRGLRELLDA